MNNKKGFTLIEVALSLAILGIISIGFLTVASNNFSFFNRAREISQTVFETQQEIELFIDKVKEGVRQEGKNLTVGELLNIEGDISLLFKETTDFIWGDLGTDEKPQGIKVKYFEVEEAHNNKIYATLVSDDRPAIDDSLLELQAIGIQIKKDSDDVPYAYNTESFSIIGNFENDEEDINSRYNHLLNVIEWYVTREGFSMPMPIDTIPDEYLYCYPVFPRDYILIENDTIYDFGSHEKALSDLDLGPNKGKHIGRHIVFTATPGAKSGKIGAQSVSKPVFISGLPVTNIDDLLIHLDASFVGSHDSIKEINKINGETDVYVKRWNDISSNFSSDGFIRAATPVNPDKKPLLLKTDSKETFIGQFVRFNNENQILEIQNQNTVQKNIYIFAAVKNNTEDSDAIFLKNGENYVKVLGSLEENPTGEWIIVKKLINNISSNNFEIGGPGVDIAELVVFLASGNNGLSEEDINKLEDYFLSKYGTNIIVGSED